MEGPGGRMGAYKFSGLTPEELRRRREETQVGLRRAAREDSLNKRRNLPAMAGAAAPVQPPMHQGVPPQGAMQQAHTQGNGMAQFLAEDYGAGSSMRGQSAAEVMAGAAARLCSGDFDAQYGACVDVRRLLATERDAPVAEAVSAGLVPLLVEVMAGRSPAMASAYAALAGAPAGERDAMEAAIERTQFEAAWALTNVASGETEHTLAVVEARAVPVLVGLLRHRNAEVREQCIWALGNIAGDGPVLRDHVVAQGAVAPLVENLRYALGRVASRARPAPGDDVDARTVRNAAWVLSNLLRGAPAPRPADVAPALPALAEVFSLGDDGASSDAAWAFAYATADESLRAAVVAGGFVPVLVPLLARPESGAAVPALRAVGNCVSGDEGETQAAIDAGALPLFRALLGARRATLAKEAAWALSNVTAGTPAQISAALAADVVPALVARTAVGEFRVRREAAWALCNATASHATHPEHVRHLVAQGALPPLLSMLDNPSADAKFLHVALDAISNILSVGEDPATAASLGVSDANPYALAVEQAGGTDVLVKLQEHPHDAVYEKAKAIIDRFFGGQEDEGGAGSGYEDVPDGGFVFDAAADAGSFDF